MSILVANDFCQKSLALGLSGEPLLKLFAFSSPEQINLDFELGEVRGMFEQGLECFHLRKPKASIDQLKGWLTLLPEEHLSKVVIHSSYELARELPLCGIHLSQRQRSGCLNTERIVKQLKQGREKLEISTSFHNLSELRFLPPKYDYVFLSPVFPSISTPESQPPFSLKEVEMTLRHARCDIIALGGIDSSKVTSVAALGFKGLALLGALWGSDNPLAVFKEVKQTMEELPE